MGTAEKVWDIKEINMEVDKKLFVLRVAPNNYLVFQLVLKNAALHLLHKKEIPIYIGIFYFATSLNVLIFCIYPF